MLPASPNWYCAQVRPLFYLCAIIITSAIIQIPIGILRVWNAFPGLLFSRNAFLLTHPPFQGNLNQVWTVSHHILKLVLHVCYVQCKQISVQRFLQRCADMRCQPAHGSGCLWLQGVRHYGVISRVIQWRCRLHDGMWPFKASIICIDKGKHSRAIHSGFIPSFSGNRLW